MSRRRRKTPSGLLWASCFIIACTVAMSFSGALAQNHGWSIDFEGASRLRIDAYDNPFFGLAETQDFASFQYRSTIATSIRSQSGWSVYGELGFYGEEGGGARDRSLDRNDGDLLQGYLAYGREMAGWTVAGRLGRQRNPQGESRLNAAREAPNAVRTFDGVSVVAESGGARLSLFALRPVRLSPGLFDDKTNSAEAFWGAYLGRQDIRERINLDLYYFGRRDARTVWAQGAGAETRHSVGARLFGRVGAIDVNIETIYQFGKFADNAINAWGAAFDANTPLTSGRRDHRLGLRGNVVSGDRDPEDGDLQTFSAIYPRFAYYSDAATIAPANALDLQAYGLIEPSENVTFEIAAGRIWRLRETDAVYRVPYEILVPPRAGEGSRVADIAFVRAVWRLAEGVSVESAYVFSASGSVLDASQGRHLHYANLSLNWAY